MLAAKPRPMSVEDYLAWEAAQEEKWELVDGFPVLRRIRLLAGGATYVHSRLAANIIAALHPKLRGGPCSVHTADLKVKAESAVRYPDVSIDCGTPYTSLVAFTPRVLFEVLSPSTGAFTQTRVLADYQSIASVEQIVFFSQDGPEAQSWRRIEKGWAFAEHHGREAVIGLDSVGLELPLAEVYAEVEFEAEGG